MLRNNQPFDALPDEAVLTIFQAIYRPGFIESPKSAKALGQLSQVNKRFHAIAQDPSLQSFSIQITPDFRNTQVHLNLADFKKYAFSNRIKDAIAYDKKALLLSLLSQNFIDINYLDPYPSGNYYPTITHNAVSQAADWSMPALLQKGPNLSIQGAYGTPLETAKYHYKDVTTRTEKDEPCFKERAVRLSHIIAKLEQVELTNNIREANCEVSPSASGFFAKRPKVVATDDTPTNQHQNRSAL